MASSEITGFYECIGLIPVYMAKITSNILNNMVDYFRRYTIDYSLLGFYSIIIDERSSRNIVCSSLIYKGYGTRIEHLDLSGFTYYELSMLAPRQLLVLHHNKLKKELGRILKILGIREFKASTLLKPGVKCDKKNRCVISNHGRLVKGSAYLTLSVKCLGKTLQVKTAELADEVINQLFTLLVDLVNTLLNNNGYRIDKNELEKLIAEKLYNELKWYIRKYYIDLPESLEKHEFYTFI